MYSLIRHVHAEISIDEAVEAALGCMKRRAECRRRRRYAAKGRVDPRLHDHLEDQRVLPSDHPNRDDVPLLSTRARGSHLLRVVRRTKVAQSIQRRLNGLIDLDDDMRLLGPRPGPQSMVTVEMMLLAILIAADLKKSYRRTDISRVLLGLHAEVAMAVGLIDGDSNLIVPPYKVLAAQLLRMERALREGWTSEAEEGDEVIEHDLQWLINRFVEHSVPNGELRTITNITVDDTDITAWGEWNKNASIKEAEDDPVVKYLKKSLDVPDLDEPTTQTISKNTQKAIRKGLEIGPDGRPDLRHRQRRPRRSQERQFRRAGGTIQWIRRASSGSQRHHRPLPANPTRWSCIRSLHTSLGCWSILAAPIQAQRGCDSRSSPARSLPTLMTSQPTAASR